MAGIVGDEIAHDISIERADLPTGRAVEGIALERVGVVAPDPDVIAGRDRTERAGDILRLQQDLHAARVVAREEAIGSGMVAGRDHVVLRVDGQAEDPGVAVRHDRGPQLRRPSNPRPASRPECRAAHPRPAAHPRRPPGSVARSPASSRSSRTRPVSRSEQSQTSSSARRAHRCYRRRRRPPTRPISSS